MKLDQRINCFVELGEILVRNVGNVETLHATSLHSVAKTAHRHNGWFTEDNVRCAIDSIAGCLRAESIKKWVEDYRVELLNKNSRCRVGVIMAGNIPLVGFSDMLCVLMSGNVFVGKTSSKDGKLLQKVADVLAGIEPSFKEYIEFPEGPFENINAIIATGSDNTSRYFDYYFGKYPNIIRKNRNSVAVLDGTETKDEIKALGRDIFQYFGLGCRNVSKLFVPAGYVFDDFFDAIYEYKNVSENNKYANNYDYNKVMLLMNRVKVSSHKFQVQSSKSRFLDNGFLLLIEDDALASPVATLNYEYYLDDKILMERLRADSGNIQCIVSKRVNIKNRIPFGSTQQPELWDYADGVDTMKFLIELNQ